MEKIHSATLGGVQREQARNYESFMNSSNYNLKLINESSPARGEICCAADKELVFPSR